jgi:hypothetical protein
LQGSWTGELKKFAKTEAHMKSLKILVGTIGVVLFAALAIPVQLGAQGNTANKHHHYKLIDIGTFPGFSIYNRRVTTNGTTPGELDQVLNNQGNAGRRSGYRLGKSKTTATTPLPTQSTAISNMHLHGRTGV